MEGKSSIYDRKLIKNGKEISRAYVVYRPGPDHKKLCDCCDNQKVCVPICTLGNEVMIICQDCLYEIVYCFREDGE